MSSDERPLLVLTGGFQLTVAGEPVVLGHCGARLFAYLALARREVLRSRVAGELWQNSSPDRASRNLRTALWRIPRQCVGLVERRADTLAVNPALWVDVADLEARASAVLTEPVEPDVVHPIRRLTDLLPGWSDAWVIVERERLRLLCLEALEAAASTSVRQGRPALALELATTVVQAEPLRESAWRLVVLAHRDQGNVAAALRAYQAYARSLRRELGIRPSELMERLVAETRVRRA
jgi:DNA-binding SARP family transcriptional activator